MQLSYRGYHYESSTTPLPNQQDLLTVKYRGVNYNILKFTTVQTQRKSELKYRGVTYVSKGSRKNFLDF
ncbi:MAG: DUF4278 domain-containing protein [Scytonema sp. RU_4_4]|nr:DUF4278 domain-containing protein [Scytonema sp. RU_4_4]NJR72818.1 DUF4278 domain-containing protein [Scytonema sp. CRU_2_7]